MKTYKIGEIITFSEDVKLNSILTGEEKKLKNGDRAIIKPNGTAKVLDGECYGKIIPITVPENVKDFDINGITYYISEHLAIVVEDYEDDLIEYLTAKLKYALEKILW